jgi:hypothetical protein
MTARARRLTRREYADIGADIIAGNLSDAEARARWGFFKGVLARAAEEAAKTYRQPGTIPMSRRLQGIAEDACGNRVTVDAMRQLKARRWKWLTSARQAACRALRADGQSYTAISHYLLLDHTTVMHACRCPQATATRHLDTDPDVSYILVNDNRGGTQ